jgi:hypothetical protein
VEWFRPRPFVLAFFYISYHDISMGHHLRRLLGPYKLVNPYPEEVRSPTVYGTFLFDVLALGGSRELPDLSTGDASECD